MKSLSIKFKFNNTFILFLLDLKIFSVFLTFKEISSALSQLDNFFKSVSELVKNKRLVSLAKWWTLQNFIAQCKSFKYSKSRRGPRKDPCETPYAIEKRAVTIYRDTLLTDSEV